MHICLLRSDIKPALTELHEGDRRAAITTDRDLFSVNLRVWLICYPAGDCTHSRLTDQMFKLNQLSSLCNLQISLRLRQLIPVLSAACGDGAMPVWDLLSHIPACTHSSDALYLLKYYVNVIYSAAPYATPVYIWAKRKLLRCSGYN